MAIRNPLKLYGHKPTLDSLQDALKREATKRPPTGVTQGGSSRKSPGAKSAATSGTVRQS